MAVITDIQEFVIANQGSGADAVVNYINEGPWSTSTSVTVVKTGAEFYATVGASKTSPSVKMLLTTPIGTGDTTIVASGTFGQLRSVNGFKIAVPADGGYIQIDAEVIKVGTVAFSNVTPGTATCGYQAGGGGQFPLPPPFTPYTPEDYTTVTFSGCTRAQKSTTANAHIINSDIDEILLGTVSNINYDKSAGTFNTYADTSQRYFTEDVLAPLIPPPMDSPGITADCHAPYYESRVTQHLIPIPEANVTLYTIASDES